MEADPLKAVGIHCLFGLIIFYSGVLFALEI